MTTTTGPCVVKVTGQAGAWSWGGAGHAFHYIPSGSGAGQDMQDVGFPKITVDQAWFDQVSAVEGTVGGP